MASNTHTPRDSNWRMWSGVAAVAVVVIAALGYWLGWFGGAGPGDVTAPAAEQTAPATN